MNDCFYNHHPEHYPDNIKTWEELWSKSPDFKLGYKSANEGRKTTCLICKIIELRFHAFLLNRR